MGDRSQAKAFVDGLNLSDIAAVNQRFSEQAERFNLLYDCRDCVHVDVDTRKCSQLYPNDHLYKAADLRHALDPDGQLVFCKYFEAV